MTPIARELLAPSLENFGRSSTLPAEAYTAGSVFRWEQEHFFDRGWVCAGRAGGPEEAGDRRVVEWQGWLFANASGDAPTFEEHVGNLEDLIRNYGCEELVVAARHDYQIAANWKILAENYHECYHCSSIHPELCEVSPPTSGGDNLEPEGAWIGGPMDLYEGVETMSLDGKSHAPKSAPPHRGTGPHGLLLPALPEPPDKPPPRLRFDPPPQAPRPRPHRR